MNFPSLPVSLVSGSVLSASVLAVSVRCVSIEIILDGQTHGRSTDKEPVSVLQQKQDIGSTVVKMGSVASEKASHFKRRSSWLRKGAV